MSAKQQKNFRSNSSSFSEDHMSKLNFRAVRVNFCKMNAVQSDNRTKICLFRWIFLEFELLILRTFYTTPFKTS